MRLELTAATLRRWRITDSAALVTAANNRNVWLTLRDRMPRPYALADAEAYIRSQLDDPESFAFCIDAGSDAIGGIALHPQTDVNRNTAELGYWLADSHWGRGIMTEAVRAIVRYAFEAAPLERIEAFVFANNPASARVLGKSGFTRERRLRRNVIKDGQVLDSLIYSRLRGE